jgi:hypothetical protein
MAANTTFRGTGPWGLWDLFLWENTKDRIEEAYEDTTRSSTLQQILFLLYCSLVVALQSAVPDKETKMPKSEKNTKYKDIIHRGDVMSRGLNPLRAWNICLMSSAGCLPSGSATKGGMQRGRGYRKSGF